MAPTEPWALAGQRVRLRRLRAADLSHFQHYRADPEVGRYQGWVAMHDGAAAVFLAEMAESSFCPPGRWCQIGIADAGSDALIGDIGLCLAADGEALELGFTLAREWQRSGRATEAVALVLRAVWAGTAARRVVALTDARNAASVRLLQRLGFRRYATLDAVFRGEPCSEHHFVLHRAGQAGQPGPHAPVLRAGTAADAAAVARVLIDSRAALLPFAPAAHTPDEVRAWVAHTLLPAGGVTLALVEGRVQGVLATVVAADGAGWIAQLYVHPTQVGAGLGRALLAAALQALPRPVRLHTFQANVHAREFYERHGFRATAFGDGSGNEEACPDVLYELA